jgi:hypothetical protein
MKAYGEVDIALYAFIASSLDGVEWSALHYSHFSLRE